MATGGMIVSGGGNTIKEMTVDMFKVDNAVANQPIILVHSGDLAQGVTVIAAGDKIMYGISADGTTAENETVTIWGCTLKNRKRGISTESANGDGKTPSSVDKLIIDKCTFENCERASILYTISTTFSNNTVKGAKAQYSVSGAERYRKCI